MRSILARVIAIVLLFSSASHGFAEDWPMFGRSATRNPVSPEKHPPLWWRVADEDGRQPPRNIKWQAKLGMHTKGDPVVAGGLVWVGTNNQHPRDPKVAERLPALKCFREKDGAFLYQYLTTLPPGEWFQYFRHSGHTSSPLVENDRLWFTTVRGEVVCLDIGALQRGAGVPRELWKLDLRQTLGVFPSWEPMGYGKTCSIGASYKGFIFVLTGNGIDEHGKVPAPKAPSLVCLDKNTGKVIWSDNSPGDGIIEGQWASPLVVEIAGHGQVIAPMGDGWIRSFGARTGELIWKFDTNPKATIQRPDRRDRNGLFATPLFDGRHVYIGNSPHPATGAGGPAWLYCIDPTGKGDISPELQAGPGKGKPNPNSGMVWGFGGRLNKRMRFGGTLGNVAVHDGLVVAGTIRGYVYCLDAKTGQLLWIHDTLAEIVGSPLIVDGKIFVAAEDQVCILALARDRKILGVIESDELLQTSPVFANGALYLAARNTLYAIAGQEKPPAAAIPAARDQGNWPQWRGPDRTNISRETGLLQTWPADGPPLAWKTQGLGRGARSVAVAHGRIFTLGHHGDNEYVLALDEPSGKIVWKVAVGPAVKESEVMQWLSQRTPTIDGDRLYAVSAGGILVCLDTGEGREIWRKDYANDFGGAAGVWGYSDYPLVDGDKLICTPGGRDATLVALDKRTGKLLWKCPVPEETRGTHSPVIAADIAGTRMFIQQLQTGTVGIAAADGKLLWHFPRTAHGFSNVHAAIVKDDTVFCSNGWGLKPALLKLSAEAGDFRYRILYNSDLRLDPWLGSSVLVGDQLHTSCGWCMDWTTGKRLWHLFPQERSLRGTMVYADGRLYHRTPANRIVLSEPTPTGYKIHGDFQAPVSSKAPAWIFPVIAGGKLYLRDQDVLLCYDIRDPSRAPRQPDAIFVPTPQDIVERMLELATVKKSDVVYDLGCGDGRIVVTAAKKYGCRAVGVDLDPHCVRLARDSAHNEKLDKLVTIEQKDLFTVDLSQADVVALYLLPKLNAKLIPQVSKMKPGARIVSHQFPMEGIRPDRVVRHRSTEDGVEHTLYLWTTPLKKEPN